MQFMCDLPIRHEFVIPMHGGDLKPKTLRAIIQDLKISVEEFRTLL
jgi:hypothetical protein